ncbi:ABC transporter ATP-binding protein [Spiroplasma turonicum]|uniref:ABC transporter ATP-binding protein n=1 Tax=Spiroplasma turonicum TaxID=216946 RepID=A0A0K1P4W7_9MOLU|nr:ABC transporter ATP-binding protein [Spiroplasma turonicum]AKU79346.1 ABC transporter ATP-binding protein [Spiroplasma turonicum]ALX70367.1 ABC transporter ATP-binding protein [Spiroplasma turonicum]
MIELKNITREVGGFLLNKVSFKIKKGSVVAFVGDNGAGKTTTIKAMFGELNLDSGSITIDGEDIFKNNNLRKVAFFPDSNNVPMELSLRDYVNYLCSVNGMSKKEIKNNSKEVFKMLGLEKFVNKRLGQLSAGWKKRAIMASILVRTPDYIILDEPTANVDVEAKLSFMNILHELRNIGVTILITSHILEELQEMANYLVLINEGQIVYESDFDNKKESIADIYKKFRLNKVDKEKILKELYQNEGASTNEFK